MADKTDKEVQDQNGKKAKEPEAPTFMVVTAPGFFDGTVMHPPGDKVVWEVPEGWDEAEKGAHWASFDPHPDFRPLNDAAKDLIKKVRTQSPAGAQLSVGERTPATKK